MSPERRRFQVVETDEPPWSEWSDQDGGSVWREELIAELLARDNGATLYVSGTVSNQGPFYSRFDAVVLLSAPIDVLLRRIESRTTNGYGKTIEERRLILSQLANVTRRVPVEASWRVKPFGASRNGSCPWAGHS
jgi:hypothetical protein